MSHDIFNLDDLNTEVEDIDEPNSGAGTGDESKYVHSVYKMIETSNRSDFHNLDRLENILTYYISVLNA